jgi:hypothetical protein
MVFALLTTLRLQALDMAHACIMEVTMDEMFAWARVTRAALDTFWAIATSGAVSALAA